MSEKTGNKLLQTNPRKCYRPPRLMAFGKIHTIVAAGSGTMLEGFVMFLMTRRP
jgi:hypothetical protein